MTFNQNFNIAVIGLGYVGLPLATALARHFSVIGFDINQTRIDELKSGFDRTLEITSQTLKETTLSFTTNAEELAPCDIYIVTVPTPVTQDNLPDLTPLRKASETIGSVLKKEAIIVFESTVYPGITEEYCGPLIEKISGLKLGQDFYLGYSPERINPGDKTHTIDRITKVVAGQTPAVAEILKYIYGTINQGNIFVAKNIKTAEAAKVIENAQRDINIAFINEIATIVGKLGLSIYDVLGAANTKWNFLPFQPGLVGGHCIGVDPYYLAHCARLLDHEPEVILAGRRTNEGMSTFIAKTILQKMAEQTPIKSKNRFLVLGLTFKENIPDLRNTKVSELITYLKQAGHTVDVHDASADPIEAKAHYDIDLLPNLEAVGTYDCIIGAVSHESYLQLTANHFQQWLKPNGLVADIRNMWHTLPFPAEIAYWRL